MTHNKIEGISRSLESIRALLRKASSESMAYNHDIHEYPEYAADNINFYIRNAYERTLTLLDQVQLSGTYLRLENLYQEAKESGFNKEEQDPDGDSYLIWRSPLECRLDSIADFYLINESQTSVSRDLISIIRNSIYSITDTNNYDEVPQNETDVHNRIEGVLKCIFPDLKHKPTLTKPIKNFEPDTGIESLKTLIEYKYISNETEAKRVVDEVLADTRGYTSLEWSNFLFVIYETHRVKPEQEWNQLIMSCGVGGNTKAMVLHGEATHKSISKQSK